MCTSVGAVLDMHYIIRIDEERLVGYKTVYGIVHKKRDLAHIIKKCY